MRPAAPVKMTSGMLAPRWLSGMAAYSSRYTYPCKRRTHAPSFPVAAQQSGVASRNLLTTSVGLLDSGSRGSALGRNDIFVPWVSLSANGSYDMRDADRAHLSRLERNRAAAQGSARGAGLGARCSRQSFLC